MFCHRTLFHRLLRDGVSDDESHGRKLRSDAVRGELPLLHRAWREHLRYYWRLKRTQTESGMRNTCLMPKNIFHVQRGEKDTAFRDNRDKSEHSPFETVCIVITSSVYTIATCKPLLCGAALRNNVSPSPRTLQRGSSRCAYSINSYHRSCHFYRSRAAWGTRATENHSRWERKWTATLVAVLRSHEICVSGGNITGNLEKTLNKNA